MIVSIDPGDTTGIAVWSDDGQLVRKWKAPLEDFIDWADGVTFNITVVVVEDYVHARGSMNQKGSKMKASQGLGVAKALAKRHGAKLVVQKNVILNIAAMHAGVKVVKHYSDDVSAFLHGFYYLETQGIKTTALQESLKNS